MMMMMISYAPLSSNIEFMWRDKTKGLTELSWVFQSYIVYPFESGASNAVMGNLFRNFKWVTM